MGNDLLRKKTSIIVWYSIVVNKSWVVNHNMSVKWRGKVNDTLKCPFQKQSLDFRTIVVKCLYEMLIVNRTSELFEQSKSDRSNYISCTQYEFSNKVTLKHLSNCCCRNFSSLLVSVVFSSFYRRSQSLDHQENSRLDFTCRMTYRPILIPHCFRSGIFHLCRIVYIFVFTLHLINSNYDCPHKCIKVSSAPL